MKLNITSLVEPVWPLLVFSVPPSRVKPRDWMDVMLYSRMHPLGTSRSTGLEER